MAEERGVESPPYPGRGTTVKSMYRHLELLRDWIVAEQGVLTEIVPQLADQMNAPESLSHLNVWQGVALPDQHSTYQYVRRVRETWDYILREHEESWDSKIAFQKRASIVGFATAILDNCFVNSEQREMREEAHAQQLRNRLQSMQQILARTFTPPGMLGPIAEEIDWDSVFPAESQENSDGS